MNNHELTKAVWQDLAVIKQASTMDRLYEEYDKERRKKKISPDTIYQRCYPIRTKAKNNWIILLQKTPWPTRYRGIDDISFYPIVHYFGPKGHTAFKPDSASGLLFVYQAHVFTRYGQRMKLNISHPIEKILHFFTNNALTEHLVKEYKDRLFSIGICRDGALLGEYHEDIKWVFNRTFVNREVFYRYQRLAEEQMKVDVIDQAMEVLSGRHKSDYLLKKAATADAFLPAPYAGLLQQIPSNRPLILPFGN
jgi:hypothetical protein